MTAVGNYDYITEFRFSLDGSIRVAFQFAGYMETRWFAEGINSWERDLGEVVHQNVAAPLHSHFGCFKVDLDGKRGLGESLEQTTVGAAIRTNLPEHVYATKYIERAYPATETTYKPGAETANRQFAIVDNDAATSGAPRGDATPSAKPGYIVRVGPTTGQVLPDDHPFVLSSAFSKYMLAVTRRKEARGASRASMTGLARVSRWSASTTSSTARASRRRTWSWVTIGKGASSADGGSAAYQQLWLLLRPRAVQHAQRERRDGCQGRALRENENMMPIICSGCEREICVNSEDTIASERVRPQSEIRLKR